MHRRFNRLCLLTLVVFACSCTLLMAQAVSSAAGAVPSRPQGPCDIYAAAGTPCVAAHSTTRALFASYDGPLYQVLRQSDAKTLDIGVVRPSVSPVPDAGGYADAAAQDAFCAHTYCWIAKIYDQSPKHNDLTQAPRGGFSGPALGGFNNLPLADMAPVTVLGHKVYGVFIEPGMGLRNDDPRGTAVDDQAQGQYWVINGKHFNSGCCFDYGNAEIDSRDDDNGTMETTYFGDAPWWYHGTQPGPWIMTDQENNLVGCVNPDGTNFCLNLPNVEWRFVTAMAKGEPHHWTSMGGDAQRGPLAVMFSGPRVNATYDPMRKQGAILLGNGGDNSNGSQGTFYEGAMTAAGTFPADATDQQVQSNVVAAGYDLPRLTVAPAAAAAMPPGLQTFVPGSAQQTVVTFTNTTGSPVSGLKLSLVAPSAQWASVVSGTSEKVKSFAEPVAPHASVSATFQVTAGPAAFNGDLLARAEWTNTTHAGTSTDAAIEKVRNAEPIRINEFRISSGAANATDSFIELYNAGSKSVDISSWALTVHPAQQAIFSAVTIPVATSLAPHAFYLLGLSDSGLAAATKAGESTIHVRSIAGMKVGDTITIDSGAAAETRKIASLGTAAANHTTVWQPLPEGPIISIPAGSTNVPVASVEGLAVGQRIALGHGAGLPSVARDVEAYEVATVTAVGKPGVQAYLAADAPSGAKNMQVTSVADITAGDTIRLDIDSLGHGIETVTVACVGTAATQTNLAADAAAGATRIKVRRANGIAAGSKLTVGTPANHEEVTATAVQGQSGAEIEIQPALAHAHIRDEWVVAPGTGLDLAEPLKFSHAANLPFSDRGTGISFTPPTQFAHVSNEPVQALGTGIGLDSPLKASHAIHAVVRDAAVTTAGYQGTPAPNQWFGGPELTTYSPLFGRTIPVKEGSLVLRNAAGVVVDSLNYGGLVDPWAAEGYQAASGLGESGCRAPAPGAAGGFGPEALAGATNSSAGRFPDGVDTDSNCADFASQAATTLRIAAPSGATNIKVAHVDGFKAGRTVLIDVGANAEKAVIASVGTAGATRLHKPAAAGAATISVADVIGFHEGQSISIGSGADAETVVVLSTTMWGEASITLSKPLVHAFTEGADVCGSGITLNAPLARKHDAGSTVTDNLPTPGAPNRLYKAGHSN